MKFGQDGDYGWVGIRKERQAKQQLVNEGLLIDFSQWAKTESDVDLVDIFDMPFDNGFCFWPIMERVYGKQMSPGPQSVGNCVPYGSCLANFDRMCTELLIDGDSESLFTPFVPYSYGAGRVFIGNVYWNGHGSTGAWQIKADMQHGLLPTDIPGVPIRYDDDMQGSASTNSDWMRNRSTLEKWEPNAIDLTIGVGSSIGSFDQLKTAVVDKKQSITIASSWGFGSKGLDNKYGIVVHRRSGSWSHQMHIRAVFEIKGQWFVYVGNQWGTNAHPKVADGFALGGFVIYAEEFDTWVRQAECYVRGSINGRVFVPNFSFL